MIAMHETWHILFGRLALQDMHADGGGHAASGCAGSAKTRRTPSPEFRLVSCYS